MRFLFLYTELAQYFLSCLNALSKKANCEIHIVKWSVNKEAPFDFNFPANIKVYERENLGNHLLLQLAEKISPDVIYCSGWVDKDYLQVCKKFKNKIPVIVGVDNKWNGNIKQRLAAGLNKITIHKYFTHCWIPGKPQKEFVHKLGFDSKHTLSGFYSCDFDFFYSLYLKNEIEKSKKFPHRFIFAGRYYEFKGIKDLWKAFVELQSELSNDWELWCIGTGDIQPTSHRKIKHFGFVQPSEMEKFISDCGVFILPSRFEPWGVALHEFASAGFPLVCSNEVGAASAFLNEGENGYSFQSGNILELKMAMKKIISLTDAELFLMGKESVELAKKITPDTWAETFLSVLKSK